MKTFFKIFLLSLFFIPFTASAATTVPWTLQNINDLFFKPNTVNGNVLGISVLASSTIASTTFTANGSVGIGVNPTGAKLETQGTTTDATGNEFIAWDSTGKNVFQIANNGSTTIGSFGPCSGTSALTTTSSGTITCGAITGSGGAAYPFTPGTFGVSNTSATSTIINDTAGLVSLASSTIGNSTQGGGLTVNGGATTTLNASFLSSVIIGSTTVPTALLDVGGYGSLSPNLTNSVFAVTANTNAASGAQFYNSSTGNAAEFRFAVFDTNKTGYITVDAPGNNNSATLFGMTRGSQFLLFSNAGSRTLTVGTVDAQPLVLGTSNAERARFLSTGQFGIGTSTPTAKLTVNAQSTDTQTNVFVVASSTLTQTVNLFSVEKSGHQVTGTISKPVLSGCGTTNTINGTDENGSIIFTGTLVTACTMTLAQPVPAGQNLACQATAGSGAAFAFISATTTTSVTYGLSASVSGDTIYYDCKENIAN